MRFDDADGAGAGRLESREAGQPLPRTARIAVSTSQLMRWCAAQENWHKIHYDAVFADEFYGGALIVVNGALKHNLLHRFVVEQAAPQSWIRQLEYRCHESDAPYDELVFSGTVESKVELARGGSAVVVALQIDNVSRRWVSLTGRAIVLPSQEAADDPALLAIVKRLADLFANGNRVLERAESAFAVDQSRVRLFCEATFNYDPIHFDPDTARARGYPDVVAPALLPPHGLDLPPGTRPLDAEASRDGREGVCEVGRDLHRLLELGSQIQIVNGGSVLELASLAVLGERIQATSKLHSVRTSTGRRSGPMVVCQTLNQYRTDGDRLLLTEMQTMIMPMPSVERAQEISRSLGAVPG